MLLKYGNRLIKLHFFSVFKQSIFTILNPKPKVSNKKMSYDFISENNDNFLEITSLSKIMNNVKDGKQDYFKISTDLQKNIVISQDDKKNKLDSIFLISSLLYIQTNEKIFLSNLLLNKNNITSMFSRLSVIIIESIKNVKSLNERDTLKNIISFLNLFFVKAMILKTDYLKVYDYNLYEAYFDLYESRGTENKINNYDLKNEILIKLLLFYPMISRYDIDEKNTLSIILFDIFRSLNLFELYKQQIILDFKLARFPGDKFSLLDSNFLLALFSITQETDQFNKNLQLLCDLTYSIQFSLRLSNQILKYFSLVADKKKKTQQLYIDQILTENSEVFLESMRVIGENANDLPLNNLIYILIFSSKLNVIKYNYRIIMDVWRKSLLHLEQRFSELKFNQKVNLCYAMGKAGYLTEKIKNEMMGFLNLEYLKNFQLNSSCILKLIKAGINLKLYNNKNLQKYIEVILTQMKNLSRNEFIRFLNGLTPPLLRVKFSNPEFWNFYFSNLDKLLDDPFSSKFSIFLVLKAFPLIFNEKNKKLNISNELIVLLNELYKRALKKSQVDKLIQKNLAYFYKNEIPEEKKIIGSMLEGKINDSMKKLGVHYLEQATSKSDKIYLLIFYYFS